MSQGCVDVGSRTLPGTPDGCPAIAAIPHVCEQGPLAAACPLSCGRCPPPSPPLPPAPPGGYSPPPLTPPTVEGLLSTSISSVLTAPLGDLSVFQSARLELDPRPLRNFELLGLGVLLGLIALRLLYNVWWCMQPLRPLRRLMHAMCCFLCCCYCKCFRKGGGGDGDLLLAPGAARSDDAAPSGSAAFVSALPTACVATRHV